MKACEEVCEGFESWFLKYIFKAIENEAPDQKYSQQKNNKRKTQNC